MKMKIKSNKNEGVKKKKDITKYKQSFKKTISSHHTIKVPSTMTNIQISGFTIQQNQINFYDNFIHLYYSLIFFSILTFIYIQYSYFLYAFCSSQALDIIILMVEIRLQNDELILEKLCKLKCSQGCQNCANYIVYEMGLFCTICLSKLQEVPQAQLATLEDLSRIIAEMTENYQKSVKNGSNLLVLKAEAETQGKVIKGLRDALTIDVKSVFSKVSSLTGGAQNSCINQYKNEPLEDFFEPSLTTSVLLNDSELFINNLHNLKVVCDGKKVSYQFKESQKNPEAAKVKALKQIEQTGNALNNAQNKVRNIMGRFRDAIKNN